MKVERNGFGLALDLVDGIESDELSDGHGPGRLPPTTVGRAANGAIDDSWPAERAEITREVRAGGTLIFSVAHAPGAGYLLTMPAYGRFLIDETGTSVLCAPAAGAEWPTALLVQALPIASTLRGFEPFHASGVTLGDAALMISGPVTAGKSTLAARLVAGGARLLSDDVVALDAPDGVVRAHPGGRCIHLRDDRIASGAGDRLRPAGTREGRMRYLAPVAPEPVPLRAVYVLAPDGAAPAAIVREPAPALTLLGATYNLSVREPARLRRQLDLVQRVAAGVPTYRATIAPAVDARRFAALIRRHFESEALGA